MAARSYDFHHVDVFTDTLFEGNPLAVFADARGLDEATMQRIARELNLSETTFVFPPQSPGALAALRIFTPAAELPFAGHPTIGTAFVLWSTGAIPRDRREFVFDEGVGPVPVRLEPGERFMAWLRTPPVTFEPPIADRAGIAAALGAREADLLDVPVQICSAGVPFLYVAMRDPSVVDATDPDVTALRRAAGAAAASGVYVFAVTDTGVYSRMFAPQFGIIEDPATGSATGPLAAFLLEYGLVHGNDGLRFIAEQGTHMGRRSILHVLIGGTGPARTIEVGGSAVHAITARFDL